MKPVLPVLCATLLAQAPAFSSVPLDRLFAEPRTPEGWPVWAVEDRASSGTGIRTWSWVNFDFWKADDELLPSGLFGPVGLEILELQPTKE